MNILGKTIFIVLLIGIPLRALEADNLLSSTHLPNNPELELQEVVVVVLSQPDDYHAGLALQLRDNVTKQARDLNQKPPTIHLTHEEFNFPGAWTVLPLVPFLVDRYRHNASWVFICEDRTHINVSMLIRTLQQYDHKQEIWIGHALFDRDATIIHHFAFFEDPTKFKYPHLGAGVAFSLPLLKRLSHHFSRKADFPDFSIDSAHELAMFVHNKGNGKLLKHSSNFCYSPASHCATFPKPFQPCGEVVPLDSIYFAVKTCEKFHKERLPIVQKTWARHAKIIQYFSETEDSTIPTVGLNIENTESGHCRKTMAIFSKIYLEITKQKNRKSQLSNVKWVVLADDDTILSVARLQQLLSCHDNKIPVAIGERYGYNLHSKQGYNYITGGGGMVVSVPLLKSIVQQCKCPSPKSPDDMLLGLCLARQGVAITHSPYFHQARPSDYAPEYLGAASSQVSFHKHWMIDPIAVYEKWFSNADQQMASHDHNHHEL